MKQTEAYQRLVEKGIRPSLQRIAIMDWLINHPTHPTIEDVYKGLDWKVSQHEQDNRLQYTQNVWVSTMRLKWSQSMNIACVMMEILKATFTSIAEIVAR